MAHLFALEDRVWQVNLARRVEIIDSAAVTIRHKPNVIAIPATRQSPGQFGGGLYTGEGIPVEEARLQRGNTIVLGANASREIENPDAVWPGTTLYGGMIFHHYGHFLLEGLSRLWSLIPAGEIDRIAFHVQRPGDLPAYAIACFEALIPEGVKLHLLTEPALFKNMLVPDPAFVIGTKVSRAALLPFNTIGTAVRSSIESVSASPRLYLSRSGLLANQYRQASGEIELELALRREGWHVIHPEQHSFSAQVKMICDAKVVMGLEGSALHTTLFAGEGTLICLTNDDWGPNKNFFLCDLLMNGRTIFVPTCAVDRSTEITRRAKAPLRLDVQSTLATIRHLEKEGRLS